MSRELVNYKDVLIPQELSGMISYMKNVEDYREELRILAGQWDLLTILGQISGTGTNMTSTREGFKHLTNELLTQLGLENLKKVIQEVGSKSQVAVDIVIRNLFERTADIGFLATDDDIRLFIKNLNDINNMSREECDESNYNKTEMKRELRASIKERFIEYTKKYSVYFDIVLVDTEGNILARMDDSYDVTRSNDEIIRESLTTGEEYVEAFRPTDMLPGEDDSLLYAYRVTENNDPKSDPLGVLCLCFKFENEMAGIFSNLTSSDDWALICLLDSTGRVLASSCRKQIPVGEQMEMVLSNQYGLVKSGGRLYLAKTSPTKGYQGFMGLGWYGHVMIPVEHAFDMSVTGKELDEMVLHSVMSDPKLFSKELRDIPVQADKIQNELERTVWNGNIAGDDRKSKILLWNISDAGAKTKKVFQDSIDNLHETVISTVLSNVWFWAALSVDIMDRNLYERANDCRWWALTSAFKKILKSSDIGNESADEMSQILKYINNLYTVYTNLFIYDRHGKVIAVSNDTESYLVGTTVSDAWVRETLSLRDSQKYSVSDFEATELYGSRHTYIYGASITDPDTSDVLGGIGIVFDSEPEFEAMLSDSLPREAGGDILEGCFGVFANRQGTVISSTRPDIKAGDSFHFPDHFFKMRNGSGTSEIVSYEGQHYAVGAHVSSGYREYKTEDSYVNDVIGFVLVPLAEIKDIDSSTARKRELEVEARSPSKGEKTIEVATFYIGSRWLGLRTDYVVQAVNPEGLTLVPGTSSFVKGQILFDGTPTVVLDIRGILNEPPKDITKDSQVVILDAGSVKVGLLVDGLGAIPEVAESRVETPDCVVEETRYTDVIIKPENGSADQEMLVVLHPKGLISFIKDMV